MAQKKFFIREKNGNIIFFYCFDNILHKIGIWIGAQNVSSFRFYLGRISWAILAPKKYNIQCPIYTFFVQINADYNLITYSYIHLIGNISTLENRNMFSVWLENNIKISTFYQEFENKLSKRQENYFKTILLYRY